MIESKETANCLSIFVAQGKTPNLQDCDKQTWVKNKRK